MSDAIKLFGDKIVEEFHKLSLPNPRFWQLGINFHDYFPNHQESQSELYSVYNWHNGCPENPAASMGDLWIIPNFYMISIEESMQINKALQNEANWDKNWFPLLADGAGDFIYWKLNLIQNNSCPIFISASEGGIEDVQIYDGIARMFETIWNCYAQGVYFIADDGLLDVDYDGERQLASALNPNSPYWICA